MANKTELLTDLLIQLNIKLTDEQISRFMRYYEMLIDTNNVLNIICIVVGIYILLDGLLKIQIAIDSKRFGLSKWWLIMTAAIVTGIVGLMLIIRPDEGVRFATVLLGISLIFEGILNLVTALTAVKIMRSSQSSDDIIDIEINE